MRRRCLGLGAHALVRRLYRDPGVRVQARHLHHDPVARWSYRYRGFRWRCVSYLSYLQNLRRSRHLSHLWP